MLCVPSAQVSKAVTLILNRLAPANFEKLANDLASLEIKSRTVLEAVINLVFEKALNDMFFQDMYARLCNILSDKAGEWCQAFLRVRVWRPVPRPWALTALSTRVR